MWSLSRARDYSKCFILLTHLIFTTIPRGRYYYFNAHFTDAEPEA